MLKNGIFCEMVILVVFKVFLLVKNLEILIQIVPDSPIYYYSIQQVNFTGNLARNPVPNTTMFFIIEEAKETI